MLKNKQTNIHTQTQKPNNAHYIKKEYIGPTEDLPLGVQSVCVCVFGKGVRNEDKRKEKINM